jgi:flagellar protein FliO/FliZ
MNYLAVAILAVATLPAVAADTAVGTVDRASGLQAILGFAAVLALLAAAAWILKRVGVSRSHGGSLVKIVGGVSVGGRERVLIVEAADQWIVVGVAPGRVTALTTMPRQETPKSPANGQARNRVFAGLLQDIETRNGK